MSSKFYYEGPVFIFDQCVEPNWKAESIAISEAKAKSNMMYRFKKIHKLDIENSKIIFDGVFYEIPMEET